MNGTAQGIAFFLLLGLALLADGIMESLGPAGFSLVGAVVILAAWVLAAWPAPKKKRRPRR